MSHSHNSDSSLIWLAGISGVALAAGALAEFTQLLPGNVALPFYLVAYATGGYHGLRETIKDLLEFRINIDFLMIAAAAGAAFLGQWTEGAIRSEEHTSELQSRGHLVCRLLLEKKKSRPKV